MDMSTVWNEEMTSIQRQVSMSLTAIKHAFQQNGAVFKDYFLSPRFKTDFLDTLNTQIKAAYEQFECFSKRQDELNTIISSAMNGSTVAPVLSSCTTEVHAISSGATQMHQPNARTNVDTGNKTWNAGTLVMTPIAVTRPEQSGQNLMAPVTRTETTTKKSHTVIRKQRSRARANGKPFLCVICRKDFKHKKSLLKHFDNIHAKGYVIPLLK